MAKANSVRLLHIESDELQKLYGRFAKMPEVMIPLVTKELRGFGRAMGDELEREIPVFSGHLRDTIKVVVRNPNTRGVSLDISIGDAKRPPVVVNTILYGSRPHIIKAKRPWLRTKHGLIPMLLFRAGAGIGAPFKRVGSKGTAGNWVMKKQVHHPGTEPNNFFKRALDTMIPSLDVVLKRIGKITIETAEEP